MKCLLTSNKETNIVGNKYNYIPLQCGYIQADIQISKQKCTAKMGSE